MANENAEIVRTWFEDASRGASLDLVLPVSKDADLPSLLRKDGSMVLSELAVRRNLFFDEQTNVLIIWRTSISEEQVNRLLPSLELRVAAHATDAIPQSNSNAAVASGKYDMVFTSISADRDATICLSESSTFVLWTTTLHLARPRVRLQRPAIYFTATLALSSGAPGESGDKEEYLPSYEPLPANVLKPLQADPALLNSGIYLPESRINKVAPPTPHLLDIAKPIRGSTKRALPVVPAVFSKIRYSSLPNAMVASLHVETSTLLPGPALIQHVSFDVAVSDVQTLNNLDWPVQLQAGDELVILYRIPTSGGSSKETESLQKGPTTVSIAISASISTGHEPSLAVDVSWQTQADLSPTHSKKPSYRWSRPLSTSFSRSARLSESAHSRNTSQDIAQEGSRDQSSVAFTFTGVETIYHNKSFRLNVTCNNRCPRTRRFALIMLPHRRPRSNRQSSVNAGGHDLAAKIFNPQRSEDAQPPDVLDLNADVRIGPFPPGACFQTFMSFWIAKTGVLALGTLRIVDLESRQVTDVHDLPDLVAIDGPGS